MDKRKIQPMNIAVFASGKGSNFSAIAKAVKNGEIKANLALLVCDNPRALALEKAKRAKIKTFLAERKDFSSKSGFESEIIRELTKEKIDLIVLAGFMRILSPDFVRRYKGRILNVHPALLPAFKGAQAIKDAYSYGVKATGVTVHFVDENIDSGPVILQGSVNIAENETLRSLEKKIHRLEHSLYPQAVKLFTEGNLKILGRKVRISTR
ncbi:MAG: phosphoribosylglycinamide formyltransferase [Candidatus Omnitrophica bacterium]|nr:phosphoribosylglycinamide formyltransferase [Candidatus Omnitrophota bacterium]